jgi:hypothetical protein
VIAGLTRRLDYLAGLGVDCLWLNPDSSRLHDLASRAFEHPGL